MLCGTNDIDNILSVQRNNHSDVNIDYAYFDEHKFGKSLNDIKNLVDFIHSWSINAQINMLNILPRASIHRNKVINGINQYLINICNQGSFLKYIDTESNLYLFSSNDGFRKAMFFKSIGTDNVHLNKSGVIRLGKHLKYLLHLDCPRRQKITI